MTVIARGATRTCTVTAAEGTKCPRCWHYHDFAHETHDGLCHTCQRAILESWPDHEAAPAIHAKITAVLQKYCIRPASEPCPASHDEALEKDRRETVAALREIADQLERDELTRVICVCADKDGGNRILMLGTTEGNIGAIECAKTLLVRTIIGGE